MRSVLRDPRDRLDVALTLVPPLAVLLLPSPGTVALCVWWLGNTVAHGAVHRRYFTARGAERAFSVWLTLLLGVPQRLWAQRHLAHHAGRRWRPQRDPWLVGELALLVIAWTALAVAVPAWLASVYAPGVAGGLLLAAVHGWFEHARGVTTSCHTRWWNVPMLNDGLHAEHHRRPAVSWRDLAPDAGVCTSVWPPPLRALAWLRAAAWLDTLERLVLVCAWLRGRVLAAHRRALATALAREVAPRRIVVVGGGLFPRSALLLRERFPHASIEVLDGDGRHLAAAARWLPPGVRVRCGTFVPGDVLPADLVVLPLALRGCRDAAIAAPPAPLLLVHDWAWRRRGSGAIVAWWLCKRMYVVHTARAVCAAAAVRSA